MLLKVEASLKAMDDELDAEEKVMRKKHNY